MKVKEYGYNKKNEIGYIIYFPNFIERLFGVKPYRIRYKNTNRIFTYGSQIVWANMITGECERVPVLDCAVTLSDIS